MLNKKAEDERGVGANVRIIYCCISSIALICYDLIIRHHSIITDHECMSVVIGAACALKLLNGTVICCVEK